MEPEKLTVRLKRDCRLRPYNVSQCDVTLTVNLKSGDDLEESYKDTYEAVEYFVNDMIEKEKLKDAIENIDGEQ